MKKIFAIVLSILLVAVVFAGCSKKNTGGESLDSELSTVINDSEQGSEEMDQDSEDLSQDTSSVEEPEIQVTDTFIFGGNDKNGKTYLLEQGERNFYYLCSPEKNKNGVYDFSKFSELELTAAEEWKPSSADQAMYGNGYWYTLKDDGSVFPCDGFSGVVQFRAPEDGKYNITINYYGLVKWDAPDEPTDIIPDGVYLSAFIKDEKILEYDATEKKMDVLKFTREEVELKKGETITVISDPKKNSGWDLSNWNIIVDKLG